jgi:cellobiose phosphorylase
MALVYSNPELLREQIIKSAGHQFQEGDVQHWWHPPFRGVRTRITDDLLFLPYVTAEYIEKTGDFGILEEKIHFLKDQPLEPDERERYNIPQVSEEKATLYEHCIRAIDRSLCFGKHGLPLIGTGDWNDGMDSVGEKGKGESIWLGWFLYTTLDRFIPICRARKDKKRAERYEKVAAELVESIEKNGWDGGWYRRAYFDDGTPLGSEHNEECRIDSISQSWSVISGAGKLSRTREAMRALEHYLINREEGLIKLLTPPFDKSPLEPGYIKGYVPGVRENGGQYTHAAVWTVLAFAKMGDGNKAWELFHMINPVNHTRTPIELCKYKVEPYVTSADVYTVPPHTGRGGWTWYTGSAGWMYRVGIEWILGFKLRGNRFAIDPCIPKEWREYSINYRFKGTLFHIRVLNPEGINRGVKAIFLDGKKLPGGYVPLTDDGVEHEVQVVLGQSTSRLDSTTGNSS